MYLTEGEGKTLFKEAGIVVPDFLLLDAGDSIPPHLSYPVMLKAQTVTGGRGKSGLIREAADQSEAEHALSLLFKQRYSKRPFEKVLVEPRFVAKREYYLAIAYDPELRLPALILSRFGGMDIEVVSKRQPEAILRLPISWQSGLLREQVFDLLTRAEMKDGSQQSFYEIIAKLYEVFCQFDCELAEINPLVETEQGLVAVDSKIILDDTAAFRQDLPFPRRAGARQLTKREEDARAIDARSHRGVVGRTFLELDGDIAFLSSGGGASVTCLDALIHYGGRPADFAEYSGNPEREDVRDLTELLLSKEGLRAFWVVGPTANFTDVYETIAGILDAVKDVRPTYPIIIRRAGPRDKEARQLVEQTQKETGLDMQFFGEEVPMTETARLLLEKIGTE